MELNHNKMGMHRRGDTLSEWYTTDLGVAVIHVNNFSGVWECRIVAAKTKIRRGFDNKENAEIWGLALVKKMLNDALDLVKQECK